MIYFSEIKNKPVYTEDGIRVGKLNDLIFLATDKPNVKKLVVDAVSHQTLIIPIEYVLKIRERIILSKKYQKSELVENELFIEKNLLDKQIIDIKGSKIVRVNDIAIQDKPQYYVAGADIGILGILRWFKLERRVQNISTKLGIHIAPNFLSWADIQPLELARGRVQLKTELEKLEKIRPEDLADYLEQTNVKNITKILNVLDEEFAAEVIGNLNVNYQNALFKHFNDTKTAKIVSLIDPDEAVDILLTFSPKKREQIVKLLSQEKRHEIEYLLSLSKTPIGEILTSEYMIAAPDDTARVILDKIRTQTADFSFMNYVYVINKQEQLIGVINLHELIMQLPDTPAYRFMTQDVVVVHLTTPEDIAIKKMLKYELQALPVIDKDKKLLGMITIDDISEFILELI